MTRETRRHASARKLSARLTLQLDGRQYVIDDTPAARALIGQSITIHTYRDGRIELRNAGLVLTYSVHEPSKLAEPIYVDSKSLHQAVDRVTLEKPKRLRPCRKHPDPAGVVLGVKAAKKMSAEKRNR